MRCGSGGWRAARTRRPVPRRRAAAARRPHRPCPCGGGFRARYSWRPSSPPLLYSSDQGHRRSRGRSARPAVPGLAIERLRQLSEKMGQYDPAAVHPALNFRGRGLEDRGGLPERKLLYVAEQERGAVDRAEPIERLENGRLREGRVRTAVNERAPQREPIQQACGGNAGWLG